METDNEWVMKFRKIYGYRDGEKFFELQRRRVIPTLRRLLRIPQIRKVKSGCPPATDPSSHIYNPSYSSSYDCDAPKLGRQGAPASAQVPLTSNSIGTAHPFESPEENKKSLSMLKPTSPSCPLLFPLIWAL